MTKYLCKLCKYKTERKSNYDSHLKSNKHQKKVDNNTFKETIDNPSNKSKLVALLKNLIKETDKKSLQLPQDNIINDLKIRMDKVQSSPDSSPDSSPENMPTKHKIMPTLSEEDDNNSDYKYVCRG